MAFDDGKVACVLYRVPLAPLLQRLEGTGLCPVLAGASHGLVTLTWFDYGGSGLGPYGELALGIVVTGRPTRGLRHLADLWQLSPLAGKLSPLTRRLGPLMSRLGPLVSDGELGAWVVSLPVTSETARAAGIEVFGYPKFLCEMAFTWSVGCLNTTLLCEGRRILSMRVPLGPGIPVPVGRLITFTRRDTQLLKTEIPVKWRGTLARAHGLQLELEAPEHPLSRDLQALGLPAEALAVLHGGGYQATLNAPVAWAAQS